MTFPVLLGLIFLLGGLVCAAVLPLIKRGARLFNFTDNPANDGLKIHNKPIPFLGGLAILVSIAAVALGSTVAETFGVFGVLYASPTLWTVFLAGIVVWLFGLWDDLKWQVRSTPALLQKIVSQIVMATLASVLLMSADAGVILSTSTLVGSLIGAVLLITLINASNIIDGLDGLLAGLVALSSLGFFVIFLHEQNALGMIIAALTGGAALGFLLHNFPPASIFLGDNGSYLFGFLVSVQMFFALKILSPLLILSLLLVVGLPLVNCIYIIIRRTLKKQVPLLADRDHFYDALHRRVGSIKKTLFILYGIQAALVVCGLALYRFL